MVFLWWCGGVFVLFLWWCFCGVLVVVFVMVFLCFCGGGVFVVFLGWCFCGGVVVFLWCSWGGVYVVV